MQRLDRRQFLTSLGTLAAASTLAGCSLPSRTSEALHLQVLEKSLPPQAIGRFRRQGGPVRVSLMPQLADGLAMLQDLTARAAANGPGWRHWLPGGGGSTVPDLITLGDTWLADAIAADLLQPFAPEDWALPVQWPGWTRWRQVIQRAGNIWGVPYRWGTAVLAYRRDKLAWMPTHWEDLWRPDLHQRLSLPDTPRLPLGLTLKTLGAGFNEPDPSGIAGLRAKLARLQEKTRYYSSRDYLQPLVLGDTWAAVGWSADVLALARQYPNIGAVVPAEGTVLWADLWVRPRQETPTALSQRGRDWLAFCGQPETARLLTRFARGTSPVVFPEIDTPDLEIGPGVMTRSEFLLPLPEAVWEQYRSLWLAMRRGEL